MRGMGGEGGRVKDKVTLGLAWGSGALTFVAGFATAGTWFGGLIAGVSRLGGLAPKGPAVVLGIGLALLALDCYIDNIPNQVGLTYLFLAPSVARGVNGKLGGHTTQWSSEATHWISGFTGPWLGITAGPMMAALAGGIAVVVARRIVPKAAGGAQ